MNIIFPLRPTLLVLSFPLLPRYQSLYSSCSNKNCSFWFASILVVHPFGRGSSNTPASCIVPMQVSRHVSNRVSVHHPHRQSNRASATACNPCLHPQVWAVRRYDCWGNPHRILNYPGDQDDTFQYSWWSRKKYSSTGQTVVPDTLDMPITAKGSFVVFLATMSLRRMSFTAW